MNARTDSALTNFREGFACSQAVLAAFASDLGLPTDVALKLAAPFGGGIARRGEMCGAVTGALMVLGLKTGTISATDKDAKERTYDLAHQFLERFQARHAATDCRALLQCDISVPSELQRARAQGLFKTVCPTMVASAAEIVSELVKV